MLFCGLMFAETIMDGHETMEIFLNRWFYFPWEFLGPHPDESNVKFLILLPKNTGAVLFLKRALEFINPTLLLLVFFSKQEKH